MKLHFEYSEGDIYRRIEAWVGDVSNKKKCPYCPDCHGRLLHAPGNAQMVGYIRWLIKDPNWGTMIKRGMIAYIYVHSSYRHQGVATALWYEARNTDDPPCHSPNRTKDGKAWVAELRRRRHRIPMPDVEASRFRCHR